MATLLEDLIAFDERAFIWLNGGLHSFRKGNEDIYNLLTLMNSIGCAWSLLIVVLGVVAVSRSARGAWWRGAEVALAAGITTWIVMALKRGVHRPRPYAVLTEAFDDGRVFTAFGEFHTHGSFPSGHTATAWMIAVLLIYWAQAIPEAFRRWVITLSIVVLATVVSVARVYAGSHWPLDVVTGMLIGITGGLVSVITFRLLRGPIPGREALDP